MSRGAVFYAKVLFCVFGGLCMLLCAALVVGAGGDNQDTGSVSSAGSGESERIEELERTAESSGARAVDGLAELEDVAEQREGIIESIATDIISGEAGVRSIGEISQRSLELIGATEDIVRKALEEGER